jgi:hypothetical protein
MIRLATLVFLLISTPAIAWEWHVWLFQDDTEGRVPGMIAACIGSVNDPQWGIKTFDQAEWQRVDEYDGSASYQSGDDYAMFSLDPGFCMFETPRLGTDGLVAWLTEFEAISIGKDAAGCAMFSFPSASESAGKIIIATLTGPGNDPACTSDTEAALRFEVTE